MELNIDLIRSAKHVDDCGRPMATLILLFDFCNRKQKSFKDFSCIFVGMRHSCHHSLNFQLYVLLLILHSDGTQTATVMRQLSQLAFEIHTRYISVPNFVVFPPKNRLKRKE